MNFVIIIEYTNNILELVTNVAYSNFQQQENHPIISFNAILMSVIDVTSQKYWKIINSDCMEDTFKKLKLEIFKHNQLCKMNRTSVTFNGNRFFEIEELFSHLQI